MGVAARQSEPLTRWCGLYEKTSAKGGTYFVGALGGLRLVILRDTFAAEGAPGWTLFVAPRAERSSRGPASPSRSGLEVAELGGMPPLTKSRHRTPRQSSLPLSERPRVDPDLNDELPEDWLA